MKKKAQKNTGKQTTTAKVKAANQLLTYPSVWWKDTTTLLLLASLIVVTFIVLSPVLNAGFIFYDDDYYVFNNINIKAFTYQNIKTIFTTECSGNYNPLTLLSFAIDHYFFKLNPFHYHLHNLLLHLINTLLVFSFMTLIGLNKYWAYVVAMLFGIHPMHVESVAWVTERKDVLFAMFYLIAIISYLYYHKFKKIKYLLLIYLFFLLSLLSKIQAVSLPLTLLAIDYIMKRPLKLRLIVEKIPYFIMSVGIGLIGIHFLKSRQTLNVLDYTLIERIVVGSSSLCFYLLRAILPVNLMIVHKLLLPGKLDMLLYITPLIIIIISTLVYLTAKHTRAILFGIIFFIVNIIFLLQVVPAGNAYNAERFSYISYIGLFYIMVYAFDLLIKKRKNLKNPLIAFISCILLLFSIMSYTRAQNWKNTETLFTDLINKDPETFIGYDARSTYYKDKKNYDKAIEDISKQLSLSPSNNLFRRRADLYYETGAYDKAFDDLNIAIKGNPTDTAAYQNRGVIYAMKKEYNLAIAEFNKSLSINPNLITSIRNRARMYNMAKQSENCIKDCNYILNLYPEEGDFYNLRAISKYELKQYDAALADYDLALKYGSNAASVYVNLSLLHKEIGDKKKALEEVLKAKSLGKDIPQDYINSLSK